MINNKFIKLILILGFFIPVTLFGQKELSHYRRAPDVLPGTLPEMLTPDFWMDRMEHPELIK